jgi:AsmA family protein
MTQPHSQTDASPSLKPRRLKKIAKWTSISLLSPMILLTGVLSYGVNLDLVPHRAYINQWLTDNLHRDAEITGDIELEISFNPAIRLEGLMISNIEAIPWQPMLTSGYLEAQISVLPLLNNTLEIDHLELENIALNLAKTADNVTNWAFNEPPSPSSVTSLNTNDESQFPAPSDTGLPFTLRLSDSISAKKITVAYENQPQNQYVGLFLENLNLTKPDTWQLDVKGHTMGQDYDLTLEGDLENLINEHQGSFNAEGEFAGAKLNINANVVPLQQGESHATVQLDWQDTRPIEDLLGLDVKPIAPLSINADITASKNHFSITDLALKSPITQAKGYLDVKLDVPYTDGHNFIEGQLNIPLIDLRPWLQPEVPQPVMMSAYGAAPQLSPLQRALDQWLMKTTTKIGVNIGEIKGLGTNVADLSLDIEGIDGKLHAPMTADIANVPFRGSATIDATEWTSNVDITLGAKDSSLGEIAGWLTGIPYASGHLTSSELTVTTQGTKLQEWLDNSKIALSIDDANVGWGNQAIFAIDTAQLTAGMNRPFSSDIQGELMGISTEVTARAGTLGDIINGRNWSTHLRINSPVLDVKAQGLLVGTQWQEGSWFNLTVQGDDVSHLSPWLGTQTNVNGEIALNGKLTYQDKWINLDIPVLSLMNSRGQFTAKWRPEDSNPFLVLDMQFDQLDFTQFGQFVNDDELPQVEQAVPTQGVNLDVPLLGNDLVIADADLSLSVKTMTWSEQHVDNVSFKGKVRNGKMPVSPFGASYAGSLYSGDLAFNLNNANISTQLNLGVNNPDIGRILSQFDVTDDLSMKLKSAQLAIDLSGRTIIELMEQAKIEARMSGGELRLADVYTGKAINVALDNGHFITGPNDATQLKIAGQASERAVSIKLDSLSLKQANDGRKSLPVSLAVNVGDIAFNTYSNITLPMDMKRLNLAFDAYTPNLDHFNVFTGVELPPYGPVKLAAQMSMDDVGYHLRDMMVQVGDSKLMGKGNIIPPIKEKDRPFIDIALHAPFIQINDFKTSGWQAWLAEKQTAESTLADSSTNSNDGDAVPVISPKGLEIVNANFKLDVDEVRSGDDWLGAGKLYWQLEQGQFTLQPLHVKLPGGDINIGGKVKAKQEMFDINLQGKVTNFDYGILARRLDPNTDMHGKISTQFSLKSIANTPETLMNNANGFIGFAAWPETFEANLIDLWAVSLTDAILPNFTNDDPSVLNCFAAGIDIKQGIMTQRDLLLDTTRIQVNGLFNASYADRAFDLYLNPKSKKAQIFSLQTPIEVHGKFDDFDLDVP